MTTILAYTSPATGHAFPLVPGLLRLQARGHRVRLVTDPTLVDTLRATGLEVEPLDRRIVDVQVTDYEVEKDSERLAVGLAQLMARGPFEIEDKSRSVPKFFILQLTAVSEEREPSISDYRERIREQLAQEKGVRRYLDNLRKQTYVAIRG